MARAGRRPGQNETREQILTAARDQFAAHGYDGATIRGIAGAAGVNAALVHHFFGTKEQVFTASMHLPIDPTTVVPALVDGPRDEFGHRMVQFFLSIWGDEQTRTPVLAMLRSLVSNDQALRMLREFVERTILAKVADGLGVPRLRLAAAASQLIGVAVLRYLVGVETLVEADDEELERLIAPVIQHYVDAPA